MRAFRFDFDRFPGLLCFDCPVLPLCFVSPAPPLRVDCPVFVPRNQHFIVLQQNGGDVGSSPRRVGFGVAAVENMVPGIARRCGGGCV